MNARLAAIRAFGALLLVAVTTLHAFAFEASDANGPPVPPGRDPGGMPVAIVGGGFDYLKEELSQRLARDGEGEIIGYDFADNDRRPFNRTAGDSNEGGGIVLSEGQATTLVVVRFDPANVLSYAKALSYAAKTPAHIILSELPAGDPKAFIMLCSAARHFRDRLFITAADRVSADAAPAAGQPAHDIANLILVTGTGAAGAALPDAQSNAVMADLATDGRLQAPTSGTQVEPSGTISSFRAAARIAALAARLLAVEPHMLGAGLKGRIAGLAKPLKEADKARSIFGYIDEPWRHFWLE